MYWDYGYGGEVAAVHPLPTGNWERREAPGEWNARRPAALKPPRQTPTQAFRMASRIRRLLAGATSNDIRVIFLGPYSNVGHGSWALNFGR